MNITPKTGNLAALQSAVHKEGSPVTLYITPKLATNITSGKWVPIRPGVYHEGITTLQAATLFQPRAVVDSIENAQHRMALLEVHNPHSDQIVNMVLAEHANLISTQPVELGGKIRGLGNLLEGVFLETASIYTTFRDELLGDIERIVMLIHQNFPDALARTSAQGECFVVRTLHQQLRQLNAGPVPTAADPTPVVITPRYSRLIDALEDGNLDPLIKLPSSLFRDPLQVPRPVPPPAAPIPAGAAGGAPNPPPANNPPPAPRPAQTRRQPVRQVPEGRPPLNPRLKSAWTALGENGFFNPGQRYHRPDTPLTRNRCVLRRANGERICIPMALTGQCMSNCTGYHDELTSAEETTVAREGNFTL